jgi:hypothetical protein
MKKSPSDLEELCCRFTGYNKEVAQTCIEPTLAGLEEEHMEVVQRIANIVEHYKNAQPRSVKGSLRKYRNWLGYSTSKKQPNCSINIALSNTRLCQDFSGAFIKS